jgi:hypothetical protein
MRSATLFALLALGAAPAWALPCPPFGFDSVVNLDLGKFTHGPWYVQLQVRGGPPWRSVGQTVFRLWPSARPGRRLAPGLGAKPTLNVIIVVPHRRSRGPRPLLMVLAAALRARCTCASCHVPTRRARTSSSPRTHSSACGEAPISGSGNSQAAQGAGVVLQARAMPAARAQRRAACGCPASAQPCHAAHAPASPSPRSTPQPGIHPQR